MGAQSWEHDKFSSGSEAARIIIAEILGTANLVFFGCGSCLTWKAFPDPTPLQIAITFGFIIASMIQVIGHISGCHINPAVTVGLFSCGRIGPFRTGVYVLSQCVGALVGAGLLFLVSPSDARGNLGAPALGEGVSVIQGLVVEAVVSGLLVLVVCAVTDPHRLDVGNAAAVAIGLAIITSHIFAIPITSASMNPARALGPAVFSTFWEHHWVYWIGPVVGAVIAGVLYRYVFTAAKDEQSYDL